MMVSKGFATFLSILLVMVFLSTSVSAQTTKPATPAGNPIKIGGSLPLTGIFSETAKWIKEGY